MYKKYKRGINITDGVDTALISTSVIMAGVGLAVPVMLPLEIVAIVCGCMGVCVKLLRRKLMSKAQKHYEIRTLGESKLNSIKSLISTALNDGQISEQEFKIVLDELNKYNDLKDKTHAKQSGLSGQEKNKLIEEGKAQALSAIQKKIKDTKFCSTSLCLSTSHRQCIKKRKINIYFCICLPDQTARALLSM